MESTYYCKYILCVNHIIGIALQMPHGGPPQHFMPHMPGPQAPMNPMQGNPGTLPPVCAF